MFGLTSILFLTAMFTSDDEQRAIVRHASSCKNS